MLQTIEAVYDPTRGLSFSEKVEIGGPVKVLVTIVEPLGRPERGSALALSAALDACPIPGFPTRRSRSRLRRRGKAGNRRWSTLTLAW